MKEIIKIKAEIKEQEMKKIVAKINETKSWFFENKTKLISLQPDSKKKRERAQINKIRNEKGHYRNTKDHETTTSKTTTSNYMLI